MAFQGRRMLHDGLGRDKRRGTGSLILYLLLPSSGDGGVAEWIRAPDVSRYGLPNPSRRKVDRDHSATNGLDLGVRLGIVHELCPVTRHRHLIIGRPKLKRIRADLTQILW